MNHRTNWKEIQCNAAITSEFNFKWQQNLIGLDFSSLNTFNQTQVNINITLKIVSHYENHRQITNKLNLIINLMKYSEVI